MSVLNLFAAPSRRARKAPERPVPWPPGAATGGPLSRALGVVILLLGAVVAWTLFDWAVLNAVVRPDPQACRAMEQAGACWGVLVEKHRLILFGRFPYEEQWRPLAATLILLGAIGAGMVRPWWGRKLAVAVVAALVAFFALMGGGLFGLAPVGTDRWGGLPLTLLLTVGGIALAYPLGILLALGRRSGLPVLRWACIAYIECVRGVPLIALLFAASFIMPLFLPPGFEIDIAIRILIAIVAFSAAYLAEVVRGGLQAIPKGQWEAAAALGLDTPKAVGLVVLPQALRIVVPPTVNTMIGVLKDTSLVTVVSLYELTGSVKLALSDPEWRAFYVEGYVLISAVYLLFGLVMSRYSAWLERQTKAASH